MNILTKIWQSRAITKTTKSRLVQSLVFSVFAYASETWTLRASDRSRIDAFQMWCWRRMLRIPWTERRTNASIIQELNISECLSSHVLGRVVRFFGHIARAKGENLEKTVMEGKIYGRRPRGRPSSRWIDQVKHTTGFTLQQALQEAEHRQRWRLLVKNCAKANGFTTLSKELDD